MRAAASALTAARAQTAAGKKEINEVAIGQ